MIYDPPGVVAGYGWPQRAPTPQLPSTRNFNAVHMALIPKGPYRGMVIVWNRDERILSSQAPPGLSQTAGSWVAYQPYAIVDPADVPLGGIRYRNFLLPIGEFSSTTLPTYAQDLFCSGHAWSPFGDLIIVGGTDYQVGPPVFHGGRLTYVHSRLQLRGGRTKPLVIPTAFNGEDVAEE